MGCFFKIKRIQEGLDMQRYCPCRTTVRSVTYEQLLMMTYLLVIGTILWSDAIFPILISACLSRHRGKMLLVGLIGWISPQNSQTFVIST
jgi:hypothetical protein